MPVGVETQYWDYTGVRPVHIVSLTHSCSVPKMCVCVCVDVVSSELYSKQTEG